MIAAVSCPAGGAPRRLPAPVRPVRRWSGGQRGASGRITVAEQRIGMVGLGNMGGRMARRLLAAGHAVAGYDRDPEQAGIYGVPAADSVAVLVRDADVVLLSLPDSSVVEPVVLGDDGVL